MYRISRKTTPRVRDGRVRRKDRTALSNLHARALGMLAFERERPGPDGVHVATRDQVRRFLPLVPEWPALTRGLEKVLLARLAHCMGWHRPGIVAICSWEREIVWEDCDPCFYAEHRGLLKKLGVPVEMSDDRIKLHFTRSTARAFQLVHVLVHELGHHRDRMTTRRRRYCGRGEPYAEGYACAFEDVILARYRREFGLAD